VQIINPPLAKGTETHSHEEEKTRIWVETEDGLQICSTRLRNDDDIFPGASSSSPGIWLLQDSPELTTSKPSVSVQPTTENIDHSFLESTCRETIRALKRPWQARERLETQIILAEHLQSCDRNSEALHLLVETLIGLFALIDSSYQLIRVIQTVSKLHSKMATHYKIIDTADRFLELSQIVCDKKSKLSF
jgi:hypothetical protein